MAANKHDAGVIKMFELEGTQPYIQGTKFRPHFYYFHPLKSNHDCFLFLYHSALHKVTRRIIANVCRPDDGSYFSLEITTMRLMFLRKRKLKTSTSLVDGLQICSHQAANLALCVMPEITAVAFTFSLPNSAWFGIRLFRYSRVPLVCHCVYPSLHCRSPDATVGGTRFAIFGRTPALSSQLRGSWCSILRYLARVCISSFWVCHGCALLHVK